MSEWEDVGPIDAEKKLKALLRELDVAGRGWIEERRDTIVGPNRKLRELEFVMSAETPKRVRQRMELLAKDNPWAEAARGSKNQNFAAGADNVIGSNELAARDVGHRFLQGGRQPSDTNSFPGGLS